MDVHRNTRERVFSILNDNDCPSFVIRQKKHTPPPTTRLPSISSLPEFCPRLERPNLSRYPHFERNPSISSAGSPPLLRYDSASSSSSKSSTSMDSTPSPITPAYNLNDATLVPYDNLLRQDLNSTFIPSPSGITPYIEQGMMIGPVPTAQDSSYSKSMSSIIPPMFPVMSVGNDMVQLPTPSLSANASVSSASSAQVAKPSSNNNNTAANNTGKKNKYPCPYAQSHNCSATFTTSGHAARHGKKHTGEKGVHCPICDKAFTRKDNMKQHERTHKNHAANANGEDKKSKAQATRDAQKAKTTKKEDSENTQQSQQPQQPARIRKSSSGISDPSDITLVNPVDTPVDISPSFFPDTNPHIVLPVDSALLADPSMSSMYPPLIDEGLVASGLLPQQSDKLLEIPQPPTLVRGFSDLDTLAQAAAYDPYYQQGQF